MSPTRRDFLKTVTTAAVGTAILPESRAFAGHVAGSDAIRIGVIGCGLIGRKRVVALGKIRGVALRHACDLDAKRAADLAALASGAKAATDYQAVLETLTAHLPRDSQHATPLDSKTVLILGAGGIARSVAHALHRANAVVTT